jgi:hypothetical protein
MATTQDNGAAGKAAVPDEVWRNGLHQLHCREDRCVLGCGCPCHRGEDLPTVDALERLERAAIPVTFDRKLGKTMPLEVAEEVLCRIYEHELLKAELAVIFADVYMGVPVRKPIRHNTDRAAKP